MKLSHTVADRFEANAYCLPNGCWYWTGYKTKGGYGTISVRTGITTTAHRVAYELWRGPIPEGLQIDHLCRNRWCVNQQHLEPVTAFENSLRGETFTSVNVRKTHCDKGHAFSVENTYWEGDKRRCRACNKAKNAAYEKIRVRAPRKHWYPHA
jgi:hypothetical protein